MSSSQKGRNESNFRNFSFMQINDLRFDYIERVTSKNVFVFFLNKTKKKLANYFANAKCISKNKNY